MPNSLDEIYDFGDFTLCVTEGVLRKGKEEIPLEPLPFKVLTHLARHADKVVRYDEFFEQVWKAGPDGTEGSLTHCVNKIRVALGDEKRRKIIETKPKVGYRLNKKEADLLKKGLVVQDQNEDLITRQTEAGDPFLETESETRTGLIRDTRVESLAPDTKAPPPDSLSTLQVDSSSAQSDHEAGQNSSPQVLGAEWEPQPLRAADEKHDVRLSEHKDKELNTRKYRSKTALKPSDVGMETFEDWISGRGFPIFFIVACCVVGTAIISALVYKTWKDPKMAEQAAAGVQCLIILGGLLHALLSSEPKSFRSDEECTNEAIVAAGFESRDEFQNDRKYLENDQNKYGWSWKFLLLSWVPLYLVFALGDYNVQPKFQEIVFNVLNTLVLLWCFNALNKERQSKGHFSAVVLNFGIAVLLVSSIFVVPIITESLKGATLLTGIYAGITMALFVGRLQSKFFGPPFWILYLLYSYTAIQPLVLYMDEHELGVYILNFALFLKCLLYLYVTWLFQSGLLLFYFASVKRTDSVIAEQRDAFRELLK